MSCTPIDVWSQSFSMVDVGFFFSGMFIIATHGVRELQTVRDKWSKADGMQFTQVFLILSRIFFDVFDDFCDWVRDWTCERAAIQLS